MQKLRVLVVEDVGSIRTIWDKILCNEVFEKSFANDGKEGLKLYKCYRPDVILLDIFMPEMTGYSVLKEIRENVGDKATTVVMQTTIAEKDDIMKCVKLGIQGYIIKPFDEKDAVQKVLKAYEAAHPTKAQAARKALEDIAAAKHLEKPLDNKESGQSDAS